LAGACADINFITSAIKRALDNGHVEVAKFLSKNVPESISEDVLLTAIHSDNIESVKLLLENMPVTREPTHLNTSSQHIVNKCIASSTGKSEIVAVLEAYKSRLLIAS
jgi:hypothetical protein